MELLLLLLHRNSLSQSLAAGVRGSHRIQRLFFGVDSSESGLAAWFDWCKKVEDKIVGGPLMKLW